MNPISTLAAPAINWGVYPVVTSYSTIYGFTEDFLRSNSSAGYLIDGGSGGNVYVFYKNEVIFTLNDYGLIQTNKKIHRTNLIVDSNGYVTYASSGASYGQTFSGNSIFLNPNGFEIGFVGFPEATPIVTPTPDYYEGFGDQDTPKGLKRWLKDLWTFLTEPEEYGTVYVGNEDTLVYTTPPPLPSPTPYVQHTQIINPSNGEVVYNIETNIENSTSQVYPTDYVWLDDIPTSVPHEFDLNFSVSGTPIEYTTDLNFSETSDAFINTVSGVSDGVNALGSLLGAMPIEIIIYPIVAFCIWAIFAFIHRLLG